MLKEPSNEEYNAYVKTVTPKHNCALNCLKAFLVGGVICTIGEAISRLLQTQAGLGMEDAGSYVSMLLVLTSVILTGLISMAHWRSSEVPEHWYRSPGLQTQWQHPVLSIRRKDRYSVSE